MNNTFQVGDRVYLVVYPIFTGTVSAVADAEYPLTVQWDEGSTSWHKPAQLDYWTRPESATEARCANCGMSANELYSDAMTTIPDEMDPICCMVSDTEVK
jgi:hypothetical protein